MMIMRERETMNYQRVPDSVLREQPGFAMAIEERRRRNEIRNQRQRDRRRLAAKTPTMKSVVSSQWETVVTLYGEALQPIKIQRNAYLSVLALDDWHRVRIMWFDMANGGELCMSFGVSIMHALFSAMAAGMTHLDFKPTPLRYDHLTRQERREITRDTFRYCVEANPR